MNNDADRPAGEEDPLEEKWLAAFRRQSGDAFIRQFYALGFYEAYDKVVSHAERLKLGVLWFKEKRACGPMSTDSFPMLESVCTYCNKQFNHQEPIPCGAARCHAEMCSKVCYSDHQQLKHR